MIPQGLSSGNGNGKLHADEPDPQRHFYRADQCGPLPGTYPENFDADPPRPSAAEEIAERIRRDYVPMPNGDKPAPAQPPTMRQTGERLAVHIIYAYFHQRYRPLFRSGHIVHCADGTELSMMTACVPDSTIIALLADASDARKEDAKHGGGAIVDALPALFTKWSKVAWGDLLHELPQEWDAELDSQSIAGERFRQAVREAMLSEVVFGDVIAHNGVTQTQRCSLIEWCEKFAKPGRWGSIRSKLCWSKLVELPGGEAQLRIAIRHGLFAQTRGDRRLIALGANRFSRLAAQYAVGRCTRADRPGGQSAVVLADEIVSDLLATVPEDDGEKLAEPEKTNLD